MEELQQTQQYGAKAFEGEERRKAKQEFEGRDRRRDAAAPEEERLRQQEELRLQDQLDRPETD